MDVIGYWWILVLVLFNFKIIYKLGKINIDVDRLFRLKEVEIVFSDIIKVIC